MFNSLPILIEAGAVMDANGLFARPGILAISTCREVVYAGAPEGLPADFPKEKAECWHQPNDLLVPGLVNAHVHLDLTGLGPRPYGGHFVGWLESVMRDKPQTPAAWWNAYEAGLLQSLRAGTVAVGDIVPHEQVTDALRARYKWNLWGMAFSEQFGLGSVCKVPAGYESFTDRRIGLQPHAPYSAGPLWYETAVQSGFPLSTHLAETPEEAEFIAQGTGPLRELLERLGKWRPEYALPYALGISPVQWMEPYLKRAPWLLAHVNYANDADLALLAKTGASVAYCPVASDYFGHRSHRYRDMLEMGINVCLGTDSIICQPAGEPHPLGILPQMRHLHRRDGTDPMLLLKMATIHGAKALGLEDGFATFRPGAEARPLALAFNPADPVHPLAQALRRSDPVEPLDVILS